ncbi:MAG: ferric reductase-like transmembrane domain-containing protein [Patescibacteria group bacterium]|jgi:predicted ferric reductase
MVNQKTIKSYISLLILALIVIVPLFILYTDVPFSRSFYPWPVLFSTLGKLSGLLGLSIFSLALLMSARFVWLDKLFYGLPKVINIHRWLGTISFTFIILHPLFLAASRLSVSNQAAFGIFTNWSQTAYLFGYISLLVFMALVLMTFFWRLQYEKLKSLHSILAVPLMIGGVHALLIDSDIKSIPLLAIYYILLISISVLLYLVRLFLVGYAIKSRRFVVSKVEQLGTSIVSITFQPDKKIIDVKPGQFIFVSFPDIKKGEEHPFSVAQIYPDHSLTIMAKNLGAYTAKLAKLKVGSVAVLDGPYGSFGDNLDLNYHQIWLAGGIGITPFVSLAQSLGVKKTGAGVVDLFYIVTSEKDLVALDIFQQAQTTYPQFKLNIYISDKEGRFDLEKLGKFVADIRACHFYICGPVGMMSALTSALLRTGIPKKNINPEAFKML